MFESGSRYASLQIKTLTVTGADGQPRQVRYVERRFVPRATAATTLVEHLVAQGDRLDIVTARYLGDPTLFWRVADANEAPRPEELTEEVGRRVIISLPQ